MTVTFRSLFAHLTKRQLPALFRIFAIFSLCCILLFLCTYKYIQVHSSCADKHILPAFPSLPASVVCCQHEPPHTAHRSSASTLVVKRPRGTYGALEHMGGRCMACTCHVTQWCAHVAARRCAPSDAPSAAGRARLCSAIGFKGGDAWHQDPAPRQRHYHVRSSHIRQVVRP